MKKYIKLLRKFFVFVGLLFVFNTLFKLVPKREGGTVYSPESYVKTIDAAINGKVVELKHFRILGVKLDNGSVYNVVRLADSRMPLNWKEDYPDEFVMVGDTLYKKANTIEFFIVRSGKRWKYYLPEVRGKE